MCSALHVFPVRWGNGVKTTSTDRDFCVTARRCPAPKGTLHQAGNCLAFWGGLHGGKLSLQKTPNFPLPAFQARLCLYPVECLDLQGTICISDQDAQPRGRGRARFLAWLPKEIPHAPCRLRVTVTTDVDLMLKIFPWLKPRAMEIYQCFSQEDVHVFAGYPTTKRGDG